MNALTAWHEINRGTSDEVVLASDFDLPGRPEARFTDLAERLDPAVALWVTDAHAVVSSFEDSVDTYVKQWVDEVEASGKRVRGVLGFCGGSLYAAAIAAEVERRRGELPPTVLFDPERSTSLGMYFQFAKAVEQLAPALSQARFGLAVEAGQRAQRGSASLAELAARLFEVFGGVSDEAFTRLGVTAERRAEFVRSVRVFLSYMAVADQVDPADVWRRSTAISSVTPTSGLNGLRALDPRAADGLVAEEVRSADRHVDLLRSAEVARTVSAVLAR
ncbi:hypothetical protein [Saccharothrix sp. HUAS TT1]|uniref:hypothetical protein n=1 Tax=unclassified Saccharothrix TaxID=2593673 RepID=UPI00345C6063